ncbi:hypothetical protein UPYG_G00160620 [Umbra pygmaea]|uniref:CASP8 and FADD-like apoptosis regulator n=1 Tax=Umbra pygmaea TaxID=75934 RepID=A0ABD0XNZ9_UMBPY
MANSQLHQMISRICEELNYVECQKLLYLCEAPETDSCTSDMRQVLLSWLGRQQVRPVYLVELLFTLRRFDLLKRVFHMNKQEVEAILSKSRAVSEYRVLMSDVSEDMGTADLDSLKFLLSGSLPKERLARVKSFLDVIVELEKCDQVSSDRVGLIEQYLKDISRVDLARKVKCYQNRISVITISKVKVWQNQADQQTLLSNMSHPVPGASPLSYNSKQNPQKNVAIMEAERRWPSCQSPMDVYRLRSDHHGQCLIIDCVGRDGEMLNETFRRLNFKVTLVKWPGVDETLSRLRQAARQSESQEADAFVCCIISRATATDLLATDSDRLGLCLETLRHLFTSDMCPGLAGKPKVFFIHTYLVSEPQHCFSELRRPPDNREEDLETDGGEGYPSLELVPTDADLFWSHCWTNVGQLEKEEHRSVYLQALKVAALNGKRRRTHLVDVHTEMNHVIFDHNRRNPETKYNINLSHTLRKNLYLG